MILNTWKKFAQCNHCSKIVKEAGYSSSFFMPVCPECGEPNDVKIVTAKLVYKGEMLKPWTWLKQEWETKG